MKAELQHYRYGFHIIVLDMQTGNKYIIDEREKIVIENNN